ncbi:exosortase [Alteromonas oceanisediminis]|uniref:exosortase n=1 Tax=Alteromonas oceanisediminis TaxID=2836180 RepID=UPI001BD97D09|nr:exosortase [Alteromonas oceanisediminis]MBT0585678.1 exosortase [Alteromonas oceanisediminis]
MQSSLHKIMVQVVLVLCVFAAVFLANPNTLADLASYSFDDGTYSHAYLIPFVIVYLLYHATRYGDIQYRWQPLFLVPLLLSLVVFMLAQLVQYPLAFRFMIPVVIGFALLSLFRLSIGLVVPIALIWFITPVWGPLQAILQQISVVAVTEIMSWTSIPAFVEGNTVHIAVGSFEIAGGCSGLRYFITSMALSLIYSYLNFTRAKSIIIFFLLAIIGSLITNWIRIFAIILIGHYTDMQSSIVEDHNTLGWYIFIPFIFALFYFGGRLERPKPLTEKPFSTPQGKDWVQPLVVIALVISVSMLSVNILKQRTPLWAVNVVDVDAEPMTDSLADPHPTIPRYSSVSENDQFNVIENAVGYQFTFNGDSGAHRADYFFNQLVPEDYIELAHDRFDRFGVIEVKSPRNQRALIFYSYAAHGVQTPRQNALLLTRVKHAHTLDMQTQITWHYLPCANTCEQVSQQVLRLNP